MKRNWIWSKMINLVVMIPLVLTACGGGGGNSSSANDTSNEGQKVHLTFTVWGDVNTGANEQQLADEFNKAHPNIQVKFEPIPSDGYGTKLTTSLAAGQAPDVFLIGEGDYYKYVDKGVVEPLDDYLSNDSSFSLDIFQKDLIDSMNINGKQYYLPKDFNPLALWYNKRMFDEAGIAYPSDDWTWDDLIEAAKQLTHKEGNKYTQFGFNAGKWEYPIYTFLWDHGTDIANEDGTQAEGYMNGEKTVAAIEKYVALSKGEERVSPTPMDTETLGGDASMFMTDKLAMMVTGRWIKSDLDKSDVEYGSALIPAGEDGTRTSIIASAGWAINAASKNKEEAYELVKWLSGTEAQKLRSDNNKVLPATVAELEEVKANEVSDQPVIAMMDYARKPVTLRSAHGPIFVEEFSKAMEKILLDQQDVKSALDEAAKNVDSKIK
ncbi:MULTISPECIES: sugar ABC transporter substrate-binding protein [Paenibacillus]|uniref:Extracellular solute-binding protein n=1 Tax=Paenibacillus campinasensis TaxID=66347 RepID=A0ABW9T1N9_9BACL|nr:MULTISPECIES: sugar ABC transporter substrate-binding protein [Paenibacillus]MUG65166.1 extracellular solute-binding protein [Paenibacillus campinasensis]PAK52279.1 ABC transporter substrate-binding protein [Paenibacillus sp. 7541]